MNNYHTHYMEAMKKLHGQDRKRICLHPGCQTVTLKFYCHKHRPVNDREKLKVVMRSLSISAKVFLTERNRD